VRKAGFELDVAPQKPRNTILEGRDGRWMGMLGLGVDREPTTCHGRLSAATGFAG
jgi:hypothetical protein